MAELTGEIRSIMQNIDAHIDGIRGAKGDKGDTGDSAYEYAVQQGYAGTEAEFAELMASYATVAESARTSRLDSEAYAIGTRDGTAVESTDPTYHNNSKWYAEQAGDSATTATTKASEASVSADRAEQAAATAGFMVMEIDSNGNLIYTKTDAVDADFEIDSNGDLIMEVV